MHRTVFAVVCVVSLVCIPHASGRFLEPWPYERLFKEADVVVIAKALTVEKSPAADGFVDERWPLRFEGVITTFEVLHVIKGKFTKNKIQVLHFKFGEPVDKGEPQEILNGPLFVEFRARSSIIKDDDGKVLERLPAPHYMLFLRKKGDGRYEPVSGRIDPVLSVRKMFATFSLE